MDLFEKFIKEHKDSECRALTDPSYNSFRERGVRKSNPRYAELHTPLETNTDLATYGDAVIKLALCEILLDKAEKLTEEKSKYESDSFFVSKVARHYCLLKYIKKDPDDEKLPDSYEYEKFGDTNKNPCKYIATAVEAVIGAIYKDTNDMGSIIGIIEKWMEL